jgi:hypothetical protein
MQSGSIRQSKPSNMVIPHMAEDDFAEIQRQLEATTSEL